MSKTKRKWIQLDYIVDGALRAEDIPYDTSINIKTAIEALAANTPQWDRNVTTGMLSPITSGDGISVDAGAEFNTEFGDNDFTIMAQTTTPAYQYKADVLEHNFYGFTNIYADYLEPTELTHSFGVFAGTTSATFYSRDVAGRASFNFGASIGGIPLSIYYDEGDNESWVSPNGGIPLFIGSPTSPNIDVRAASTTLNSLGIDQDFLINKNGNVGYAYNYDSLNDTHIIDGTSIYLTAPANLVLLDAQPTGTVDLAVSTTKYTDDAVSALTLVTAHSELSLDDGTNPHATTQTDVGLGAVNNTSDADKPVSTATQTALDLKADATDILWQKNGIVVSPATALDEFQLDYLAGVADSIPTTDIDGKLQDTDATITAGIAGGSLLNMQEFTTTPSDLSLLIGDIYVERVDTSNVKLVFFDGVDKYSTTLAKEI